MNVSRSLAASFLGTLIFAATTYGQQDQAGAPVLDAHLARLGALVKEAKELKEASRWKEFRAKYSEAGSVHQQAANELAKQKLKLDQARRQLDEAFHQVEQPQIMLQCIIAEVNDLDDDVLKVACKRVAAESLDSEADSSQPVKIFRLDSSQVTRLLSTIEKRRLYRVTSRPSILAIDNQIAEITIGQLIERPTSVRLATDGGVEVDRTSENVGVVLSVVPSVEEAGGTKLQVIVNHSFLTGSTVPLYSDPKSGDAITSPAISQVRTQATVLVPSGQTALVTLKSQPPIDDSEPTRSMLFLLTPRIVTSETKTP